MHKSSLEESAVYNPYYECKNCQYRENDKCCSFSVMCPEDIWNEGYEFGTQVQQEYYALVKNLLAMIEKQTEQLNKLSEEVAELRLESTFTNVDIKEITRNSCEYRWLAQKVGRYAAAAMNNLLEKQFGADTEAIINAYNLLFETIKNDPSYLDTNGWSRMCELVLSENRKCGKTT